MAAERVEKVAAVAIVAASLWYLVPFGRAMATTSLWNDEIYTNVVFSGRGPVRTLTYYEGSSHVLYNLVSSVLPARRSMNPLRARLVSFAAVGALLAGGLALLWLRGRALEGALFFAFFALNREFLDLGLQARGYGLEALFAGISSWAAIRWLATGRRRWLGILGAATVLGTWTLPTFVFFGGGLLVLLFLRSPGRTTFLVGAVTAAASAALYVPLWSGLMEEMRLYPTRWGRFYSGFEQVGETVRLYLVPDPLAAGPAPAWLAFAVVTALVALPGFLGEDRARHRGAAWVLLSGSMLFLTACLVLTTPPVRTTAFVAVPLVMASLALFPVPGPASRRLRAGMAVAFTLIVVPVSVRAGRSFAFVPIENWGELSRFLLDTVPRSTQIGVVKTPHILRPYLPDGNRVVAAAAPAFARGDQVVVDDTRGESPRFDGTSLAPGAVEFRFVQRRGGYVAAWLAPPSRTDVEEVRREPAASGTEWSVEMRLKPGPAYRSVTLRVEPGDPEVETGSRIVTDSGWKLLEPSAVWRGRGGLAVPLSGKRISTVVLRLRFARGATPSASAWASPAD